METFQKKLRIIPQETLQILTRFTQIYQSAGYQCFLVGGSCRDIMLGITPHDFDFAVNCPLEETGKLFSHVYPTGVRFGTLTIGFEGYQFEVTRFRKDIETDGRRAVIRFAESIEDDLKRRDLRINALAYDIINESLVDSEDGMIDFEERMIRFVGSAVDRIREDQLRALRYGRMIGNMIPRGFRYDPDELRGVVQVFDPSFLSIERVYDELGKVFKAAEKDVDFLIDFFGLLRIFRNYLTSESEAAQVVRQILIRENLLPLSVAFRRHHSLKETAERLKLSRIEKQLTELVWSFETVGEYNKIQVKNILDKGQRLPPDQIARAFKNVLDVDIHAEVKSILEQKEPYRISDLKLGGKDLLKTGFKGEGIRQMLEFLLELVWEKPKLNTRNQLLAIAKQKRRKM